MSQLGGFAMLFGGEVDGQAPDETETVGEPLWTDLDLTAWRGMWLSGVLLLPAVRDVAISSLMMLPAAPLHGQHLPAVAWQAWLRWPGGTPADVCGT